jgi:tetratricopeptide (TPR) repeat protein
MESLWERVRAGKHTALLGVPGLPSGEPTAALGVRVVRVRCDGPPTTLGPLEESRRKIELTLGSHTPLLDQARDRMVAGLRRRLLGDDRTFEVDARVVDVWNRLALSSDRPVALVFEVVDAADDATLTALARIVARPGLVKLPLVLAFRSAEPEGGAALLLGALEEAHGSECTIRLPAHEAGRAAAGAGPGSAPARALLDLPRDVLRVLRAGALVGSGFEAELVAALLGMDVIEVLETLQRAADAGVPIDDHGEARFHVPEPVLDALRASMLPSLMIAQHRRLADLLGGPDPLAPWAISPGTLLHEPSASARVPERVEPPEVAPPKLAPAPRTDGSASSHVPAVWPYAQIFGDATAPHDGRSAEPRREAAPANPSPAPTHEPSIRVAEPGPAAAASAELDEPPAARVDTPSTPPPEARRVAAHADETRAARHLAAAGDLSASAESYLAAAQKATASGAYAHALALAQKALASVEPLPTSAARRRLRAAALLEIGRLRWVTSSPDAGATLADALALIEAAREALTSEDPLRLRVEAATVIAAICYDIGDEPALARALDELTTASRLLLDAGDAMSAARLLNDQAAVYVRMGDPVRATHLLSESRRVFEPRAATDPVAMLEMADTDHLFARIPLHVAARPGRESDALSMGLDHALAAERAYKLLDARRELGRVWETMGRLELRKGRLDRARERLVEAVRLEEAMGDLVGLARSTAALSELLAASGRLEEALEVLGDSVALNVEKGSPIGLAFNRRALEALIGTGMHAHALGDVERRLAAAEAVLGRLDLPSEARPGSRGGVPPGGSADVDDGREAG